MSLMDVKKNYKTKEWDDRVEYYNKKLNEIIIPETPQTIDLKKVIAQANDLMKEALQDLAYIKSSYEKYKSMLDDEELIAFTTIKENPSLVNVKLTKLTETETKSYVHKYLVAKVTEYNKVNGKNRLTKYAILRILNGRLNFIKSVVKNIDGMKNAVVADLAALKIEASVTDD